VFPSVETLGAQAVAIVFVLGSYALAQEIRVKRPRRRAATRQQSGVPAG
jgi:high-affinity iron transporter